MARVDRTGPRDRGDLGPVATAAGSPAGELPDGIGSQTLDRGLLVLEAVTEAQEPLSVADLADRTGLHRSIVYRMVRTLEHHRLLSRAADGRYRPGARLAVLARTVFPSLRTAAASPLVELARRTGMTAFVVVPEGDLAVTLDVEEPRRSLAHVSYRPGVQHPLSAGAPGLAILAGRAPVEGERPEVEEARRRGWTRSHGEVIPGYRSCAAPVRDRTGACVGAICVVYVGDTPAEDLAPHLTAAARATEDALAGA
ncbi:transcriptional regulator, IclR family [Ornithinimicrobium cerasi]|uniref:Transcriptional regulator, IclR family n=1 Tax=Ornithinimicrobium cerasi TaxID=2248773 RepID=A0A285VS25_9MICO|nr:transcriptional regulator, IclR family [Ornithinimicrobium cerasi]